MSEFYIPNPVPFFLFFLLLISSFYVLRSQAISRFLKGIVIGLILFSLYSIFSNSYSEMIHSSCIICKGQINVYNYYFWNSKFFETKSDLVNDDPVLKEIEKVRHVHIWANDDCGYRNYLDGESAVYCKFGSIDYPSPSMILIYDCALKYLKIKKRDSSLENFEDVYFGSIKEYMKKTDTELKVIQRELKEKLK